MFKRKKKKTGVQTPEFRKPTPPPPILANKIEDNHRKHKSVSAFLVGTVENLDRFMAEHEDIVQIKNDGVYWSIKDGTLGIVTTKEWVDYFNGTSNIIPNTEENKKCDKNIGCGTTNNKPQRGLRAKANMYDDAMNPCINCVEHYKVFNMCAECGGAPNYKHFKTKEG